jgi:endoglucanase
MPPQDDPQQRVLFPVSTAATLNLAAVAAQCARIWRTIDADFSARCLEAARRAHTAALRNSEVYFIANFSGSGMYGDGELSDEFFWAGAELYATTGEAQFLKALQESPLLTAKVEAQPAWPRTAVLGLVTLAVVPNGLEPAQRKAVRHLLTDAARRFRDEGERSGYHIPYASDRYAWGSNSDLLNRAILLALAHDFTGEQAYRSAVIDVMDYLLGRNPLDQSYISGHGERAMLQPHHRFWAPSFDTGLPPPPPGALSGGPNNTAMIDPVALELRGKCAPQACWADHVEAYALNEVAINWNAPLLWVATWLQPAGSQPHTAMNN